MVIQWRLEMKSADIKETLAIWEPFFHYCLKISRVLVLVNDHEYFTALVLPYDYLQC